MLIPKIIHQTWKTTNVPFDIFEKKWIKSWKKFHPDWQYKLWTDKDIRNLVKKHYKWFLKTYDNYDAPIKRVDAGKYIILDHEGGLYADLDYECLKNFEPLLLDNICFLSCEYESLAGPVCSNALMASVSKHPFWEEVFKQLPKNKDGHILNAAGPFFLTTVFNQHAGNSVMFLKDKKLFPWKYTDGLHKFSGKIYPESYAIHYSLVTWMNQNTKGNEWIPPPKLT